MADKKATREALGNGLVEIGAENENLVVLTADLGEATRTEYFRRAYPERFVQCGIAECNMTAVAAGLGIFAGSGHPYMTQSHALGLTAFGTGLGGDAVGIVPGFMLAHAAGEQAQAQAHEPAQLVFLLFCHDQSASGSGAGR